MKLRIAGTIGGSSHAFQRHVSRGRIDPARGDGPDLAAPDRRLGADRFRLTGRAFGDGHRVVSVGPTRASSPP